MCFIVSFFSQAARTRTLTPVVECSDMMRNARFRGFNTWQTPPAATVDRRREEARPCWICCGFLLFLEHHELMLLKHQKWAALNFDGSCNSMLSSTMAWAWVTTSACDIRFSEVLRFASRPPRMETVPAVLPGGLRHVAPHDSLLRLLAHSPPAVA